MEPDMKTVKAANLKINEVLGYKGKSVVSHANNIVIIDGWCNYEL